MFFLHAAHEVRLDANFRASQWFAPTTSTQFRSLRDPEEYIPATNFGNSSVANFAAVYKILWEMIKQNLLKPLDDPISRHERSLASLKMVQKKAQSGRYGKNAMPEDTEGDRIDPALTERILDAYMVSEGRKSAFNALMEGERMEPGQEELFLGEHFFFPKLNCYQEDLFKKILHS